MGRRLLPLTIAVIALAGISSGGANAASAPLSINPVSFDFGSVIEGQPSTTQQFTVTNTGQSDIQLGQLSNSNTSDFTVSADTCSGTTLGASVQCTFNAQFTPASGQNQRGAESATVSVPDTLGDTPATLPLSGTATAPQIGISPTSVNFGDVPVNTPSTQTVTISNSTQQGTLNVGAVAVSGSNGFSVVNNGCAGAQLTTGSCQITVGFDSPTVGPASDTLTIVSNDPDQVGPTPVALSANGTQAAVGFTGNAAFNADLGSTSAPQAITVTNTGNAPLVIAPNGVSLGGTDPSSFAISSDGCSNQTVAPGTSCDVGITFTASDANPKSATLLVADNAAASPQGDALTGTANVPGITINPESVTFNSVQAGKITAAAKVSIQNTGTAALKIGTLTIVGSQAQNFFKAAPGTGDTCSGQTIAVGASCIVNVTFSPTSAGGRVADLMIPNNGLHTASVPLSGTGLWPPSPTSINVAMGCNSGRISWKLPAGMHLYLYTQVVRNASHMPTSPTDGTILPRSTGGITQTGLPHYQTYYYAVYNVFTSTLSETKHYSKPLLGSGHTGTICTPLNRSITTDLTPYSSWLPYGAGARYSVLLQRSGRTILVRFPAGASYQFPATWTYAGATHSFAKGATYNLYVYAYTQAKPRGFLIGQSQFTESG